MTASLARLQHLEFRFGTNDLSTLVAIPLGFDDRSRPETGDAKFYVVIRDKHDDRAMHDALRRSFAWVGNVPSDDIVTWASPNGNIQQQLIIRRRQLPRLAA